MIKKISIVAVLFFCLHNIHSQFFIQSDIGIHKHHASHFSNSFSHSPNYNLFTSFDIGYQYKKNKLTFGMFYKNTNSTEINVRVFENSQLVEVPSLYVKNYVGGYRLHYYREIKSFKNNLHLNILAGYNYTKYQWASEYAQLPKNNAHGTKTDGSEFIGKYTVSFPDHIDLGINLQKQYRKKWLFYSELAYEMKIGFNRLYNYRNSANVEEGGGALRCSIGIGYQLF